MKKLILFTCLLFFQSLLPSDFGLHRAQLGKALLVTVGTAAAGLGAYHLNKRGEERYKAAFENASTVDTPPQISFGWRIARNLLIVLSGADKAPQGYTHSWLPHKKFRDYLAKRTGLDHIINKDMPLIGLRQCIGWEPHIQLLALLTKKDFTLEEIKPLIDNLPEMNGMDEFKVRLTSNCSPVYLDKIVKDQNTTAYSFVLVNSPLLNVLVIYKKRLHKFTYDSRALIRDCSEEKSLDREALKSIYQHLFLQRKEAIKTLCLLRNKKGSPVVSVFPEAFQIIAEYL